VTGVVVSGAAAAVSALFAVALGRRYVARGRVNRALLYWTIALAMFFLASAGLTYGEAFGWTSPAFRLYYLLGAVLVVPWLALGTVEITAPDLPTHRILGASCLVAAGGFGIPMLRVDDPAVFVIGFVLALLWGLLLVAAPGPLANAASLALVATFTTVALVAVAAAPLLQPMPADAFPEGRVLLSDWVRAFSRGGSQVGAVIVVVGAIVSAVRLRGRGMPHMIVGNVLIALGVLIAAMGGFLAFAGDTEGHAIAFAVGVAVMYAGFVRTTRRALPDAVRPVVEVFTREDCGLCEQAERLAEEEAHDADVRLVDIDDDPDLRARYDLRVPVVAVDGEEVAEGRIEPGTIAAAVRDARSGVR
jgi:glutaredoxin